MNHSGAFDFSQRPFLVIWETTRACDLACLHCRASADPYPAVGELTYEEGQRLIEEVKRMGTPLLIFSGGDCLKRPDLEKLIAYAKLLGLRTGAIPAVTPALTPNRLEGLKDAGLDQIAFSLDAGNAEDHDAFRRTSGVFERTLESIDRANRIGLRVQINSLVNVHNENQLEGLFDIVDVFDIVFWEIFFLVPTGRGQTLPLLSAEKFEEAFEKIYEFSQRVNFTIKITEAPHYRRFCYERAMLHRSLKEIEVDKAGSFHGTHLPDDFTKGDGARNGIGRARAGVNSGKGFAFISYCGDILPSGFLPIAAGNIRRHSLAEVYRHALLFRQLRDTSLLKGRCGRCPYKDLCGGSRARAYAMTGDYLAEDPCCLYEPAGTIPREAGDEAL